MTSDVCKTLVQRKISPWNDPHLEKKNTQDTSLVPRKDDNELTHTQQKMIPINRTGTEQKMPYARPTREK